MSQKTMDQTTTREPLNGVDTPTLFATINAVDEQRDLAAFRFKSKTTWQSGTHSRTAITSFYGAGSDHEHVREFTVDSDHPAVLVGSDHGPLPVELLLTALGACLTAGIGNISAARGVELYEVECLIEGDLDIQGILGLSDQVRNGFQKIRVDYRIRGNAKEETLRKIVQQSRARSAVFDVITNQVPVEITTDGM